MDVNRIIHGDALDVLRGLPDASVDAIITDPPYGTTACAWDTVVPFEPMWALFKRIAKPNAAIVMTASQPFTSALVMSNPKMFKYQWYWQKERATGFQYARYQPMRIIEDVCVFGTGTVSYNPQLTKLDRPYKAPYPIIKSDSARMTSSGRHEDGRRKYATYTHAQPNNLLKFARDFDTNHPTQKPVALMEYLIRTYTQPGDLVLDPFAGSGTTLVAARNLQRRYIGVELQAEYVEVARKRLSEMYTLPMFDRAASGED